jgi:hypothetical protein
VWNAEGNIHVVTCWPGTKFNFSKVYDRKRLLQMQVLPNNFSIFLARASMALKSLGPISRRCCVFLSVKTSSCRSLFGTSLPVFVSALEPDQCQRRNDFTTFVFLCLLEILYESWIKFILKLPNAANWLMFGVYLLMRPKIKIQFHKTGSGYHFFR